MYKEISFDEFYNVTRQGYLSAFLNPHTQLMSNAPTVKELQFLYDQTLSKNEHDKELIQPILDKITKKLDRQDPTHQEFASSDFFREHCAKLYREKVN